MNLQEFAQVLGPKTYDLPRPAYDTQPGEDPTALKIHKQPISEAGKPNLIKQLIAERDARNEEKTGAAIEKEKIAIAYGGFLGLDITAASGLTGVLLVDINPAQKLFWDSVIDLLKECPTKEQFTSRLSIVERERGFSPRTAKDDENYKDFTTSDTTYAAIRELAMKGMMAAVTVDALDTERWNTIATLMADNNYVADIVYLSNVPHYLSNNLSGKDFYQRELANDSFEIGLSNNLNCCHLNSRIIKAHLDTSNIDMEEDAQRPLNYYKLSMSRAGDLAVVHGLEIEQWKKQGIIPIASYDNSNLFR